ncbi:MAG TPA: MarR family transcriptional regulator [Mycobacteriales bacterium]|nr:MarR family transcriptional regulator [Mycobacteriales bacterium]HET8586447.1 MarR family transcriptional regulator [Candidatus Limnocylindria bacterium]
MRLARRLRTERAETSLTLTQLAALASLDRHGPMTPGELAAHEKVQPPSMTRVLGVLGERGLIDRAPHPTDGRQALVEISAEGRRLVAADRRRRDAWLSQQMHDLSDDELALLRELAPLLDRLASS